MGLISRVSSRTYRRKSKTKVRPIKMARGNQRDLARAKNQKKEAEKNKGRKDDGLTASQRAERDAQIMREKNAKKLAQKEKEAKDKLANASASGNTGKNKMVNMGKKGSY